MEKITVYKIERETDSAYRYSIHNFDEYRLWKVMYRKDEKAGGVAWAGGVDEMAAFLNFKNAKLNSETSVKDKFEIVLGEEYADHHA